MANGNDRIVWIDLEMTGLSLERDDICEIACIVTDGELNELDEGISLVIRPSDAALAAMDEVVVRMHTESGLLTELSDGTTVDDAHAQVLAYVRRHVPEARKAPLAGSSVYVDRGFLARSMPELDAHLHYRLVDVSSVKELTKRWYPRVFFAAPQKSGNHRALGDIRDSIAELRYYRDAVFVPLPGQDTDTAKAIGENHGATQDASRA